MGLWLKCPGCQGKIPLYLPVCPSCGQSLDNLPPKQRVYVVEPGQPSAPAAPASPPSPAKAAAKAEKKPKGPKTKKK